jgi:hypothetical protein
MSFTILLLLPDVDPSGARWCHFYDALVKSDVAVSTMRSSRAMSP